MVEENLENYKGQYFNNRVEKYLDPVNGSHFRVKDMIQRLLVVKVERKLTDKRLGILTSSMILSPKDKPVQKETDHVQGRPKSSTSEKIAEIILQDDAKESAWNVYGDNTDTKLVEKDDEPGHPSDLMLEKPVNVQ